MTTAREKADLNSVDFVVQGVSKQALFISGIVWRNLDNIGDITVTEQRFLVVNEVITAVILGADFWSMFGEFALDFKGKVLQSPKVGLCVQLKENHNKEC